MLMATICKVYLPWKLQLEKCYALDVPIVAELITNHNEHNLQKKGT